MKHRSCQGCIDTGIEDVFKILHRAGPAGGNDRHGKFRSQTAVQFQIETGLFPVGIHGIHADFPGSQGHALLCPSNGIDARVFPAAFNVDLPAAAAVTLGVDRQDDALAAEAQRRSGQFSVVIRADQGLDYGQVMALLDELKGAGVTHFGLAAESGGAK